MVVSQKRLETLQKCCSVFHPQTRDPNTSWGESARTPASSLCLRRKYCPSPFRPTALPRTPTNWWVHGGHRCGWARSGGDRPVLRGAPPGLCPSASSQEGEGDLCPGDCDEWETRKHLLPPPRPRRHLCRTSCPRSAQTGDHWAPQTARKWGLRAE